MFRFIYDKIRFGKFSKKNEAQKAGQDGNGGGNQDNRSGFSIENRCDCQCSARPDRRRQRHVLPLLILQRQTKKEAAILYIDGLADSALVNESILKPLIVIIHPHTIPEEEDGMSGIEFAEQAHPYFAEA
jgi:hypothetical protein